MKKKEEEEDKEGEDEDEDKEGEDKKLAAKKKEEEGDEKSEKEVKWGDSGELDNCVRVQGDAKDERSVEISEEAASLVRMDEEEAGTQANIFDEQLGQVCHSEAGSPGKKDYEAGEPGKNEAGEPGKKDSAENEVEREENSQLLKDIGLQVIKFK